LIPAIFDSRHGSVIASVFLIGVVSLEASVLNKSRESGVVPLSLYLRRKMYG